VSEPHVRILRPEFRGASLRLFQSRASELIVSGPAGTGKTVGLCHKIHGALLKYPGARILMCRKVGQNLTTGALVTYEKQVLDPADGVTFYGGSTREPASYRYKNGSRLVIGGLDRASKVLSSEYDIIYVNEATEVTLTDWETLNTRLRANAIPYQQLLGDTNPDAPTHWIVQRAASGKLELLYSVHEDNPAYWDGSEWTDQGEAYMARLENLTGVRYKRLRKGLWVAAEGQVYEDFDPATHVKTRAELTEMFPDWETWPTLWVNDFGYRDPFVWHEWCIGPEKRMILRSEIYQTGRLVEDLAKEIVEYMKDRPRPKAVICDHDAEGRATLERHLGIRTKPAYKAITDGIQEVQKKLRATETGSGTSLPSIFIVSDARLHAADPVLIEKKSPTSTVEEFASYVWNDGDGRRKIEDRKKDEKPLDKDNHGMDTSRYAVAEVEELVHGMKGWGQDLSVLEALKKRGA
jgi:PBSX family phage terminase large subunit